MSIVDRLFRLLLLSVVSLSALKECVGTTIGRVDLTVLPTVGQSILEGGSFRVVCRATRVSYPFDLVRIVRRIGEAEYEMATNGYLTDRYRQTGRYRIVRWDDALGLLELEISYVLGADGGNIGCRSLPDGESKFEDVIVQVPARRIDLGYRTIDETNRSIHDGEKVRFQRGLVRSVVCLVNVTGSDFGPEVFVMLDTTDVTSLFEKRIVKVYKDNGGFVEAMYSAEYEWAVEVDDTWVEKAHGRNLTCTASMPMYPAIATSAVVEVEHAPVVRCDEDSSSSSSRPGEAEHRLSCRCSAFPQPDWITWSWMDGKQVESLTRTVRGSVNYSQQLNSTSKTRFHIRVEPQGNDEHDVILVINDVRPADFRSYVLRVSNELGTTEARLELLQQEEVSKYGHIVQTQESTMSSTDAVHGAGDLQPNLEMLTSMTPMSPMTPSGSWFIWVTSVAVMWLLGR